jgi:2-polyprenyl-6-methoxyphenol hydroxylase-like FAD-dependent oxidoreductase
MDKRTGAGAWRVGGSATGGRPPVFGGLVDALLLRTPPTRLQLLGLHYRQPLAEWHRGRCVLVGDAVHAPLPTSGQGVNMAVEDAYALAEALATHIPEGAAATPAAVTSAYVAFRSKRLAKTSAMVAMGRRLIDIETGVTNPFLVRLRDSAMGLAYSRGWLLAALQKQVINDLVVPLDALR